MLQRCSRLLWEVAGGTLSLLFPQRCAGCDMIDIHGFCHNCSTQLEWLEPVHCCRKCGSPTDGVTALLGCRDCRGRGFLFKGAVAALRYIGPLQRALTLWKYHDRRYLSNILAQLLIHWVSTFAPSWWEKIDLIIPAPHHPRTIKSRGFNPPIELAEPLARSFNIPLLPRTLFKIRNTAPQAGLSMEQRMNNLRLSMKVYDPSLVEDRIIVVVDDVMTTGATINECARALREAGARHVYGLVLARQPGG